MNSMNTNTSSQLHEDMTDAREAESAKNEERTSFQEYIKKRWGDTRPDVSTALNDRGY